jgi:C-terminal processing protease CtpA/Prc
MGWTKRFLLAFSIIAITGCEDFLVKPAESNRNLDDFEAAWSRVKDVYPYLEYKHLNWDSIYNEYLPRAENAEGDEIYRVLLDLLGELRDMHVYLKTPGGFNISTYYCPRWIKDKFSFNPAVVRNYFDSEPRLTGEGTIEYGLLKGNIGYIYMGTFDEDYLTNYFSEALDHVRESKSLILDIRHNNGGSLQNLVAVVSRFISSPLEKPRFYLSGELISQPPFEPLGDYQYLNPIVILINGVCYSSGDIFPEIMSQLPYVTLVGDTTAGGSSGSTSSAPALYSLPGGKKIFVGTTDWRKYDGTPYEWVGVAPDILVGQSKEDIDKGTDPQLEYAINLLNR